MGKVKRNGDVIIVEEVGEQGDILVLHCVGANSGGGV